MIYSRAIFKNYTYTYYSKTVSDDITWGNTYTSNTTPTKSKVTKIALAEFFGVGYKFSKDWFSLTFSAGIGDEFITKYDQDHSYSISAIGNTDGTINSFDAACYIGISF